MRILLIGSFLLMVVFGCGRNHAANRGRDSTTNYELDVGSFTANDLDMVERRTGLRFPRGCRGLNLLFRGHQIDAEFLAKIEIPANSETFITNQLIHFPPSDMQAASKFTGGLAWWNLSKATIRFERTFLRGQNGADVVRAFLTEENDLTILYIEWYQ